MKYVLLITILIFTSRIWADCSAYLATDLQDVASTVDLNLSPADQFKAYIDVLVKGNVVTLESLQQVIKVFQKTGQLVNPLQFDVEPSTERDAHKDNLQNYVDYFSAEGPDQVVTWLQFFIEQSINTEKSKSQVQSTTRGIFRSSFVKILMDKSTLGGSSWSYGNIVKSLQSYVKPSINHDFEIMDTPVTQMEWAQTMKDNPWAIFDNPGRDIDEQLVIPIDGKSIVLYPDWAVNGVSIWDAMMFANKMSEMHQLKPVYDLSNVELYKSTRGRWTAKYPKRLKINAVGGDVYKAEGYRLPTALEMHKALGGDESYKILQYKKAELHSLLNQGYKDDVVEQFSVKTANGKRFYYVSSDYEWLTKNSKYLSSIDDFNFMTLEANDKPYYTFYKSKMERDGDVLVTFRLARTIFKNKEESKL